MPTPTWGQGCATYPCVIYATVRGIVLAIAHTMPCLPYAVRLRPVPMRTYDLPRGIEGLRQIYLAWTRGLPTPTRRMVTPTLPAIVDNVAHVYRVARELHATLYAPSPVNLVYTVHKVDRCKPLYK